MEQLSSLLGKWQGVLFLQQRWVVVVVMVALGDQ